MKESLKCLSTSLEGMGLQLILRRGASSSEALVQLCRETNAKKVFVNKEHTPAGTERLSHLTAALGRENIALESFCTTLLYAPEAVELAGGFAGGHWGTLMPFLRACEKTGSPPKYQPAPSHASGPEIWPDSTALEDLGLARMPVRADGSVIDWGAGIRARWCAGEEAAIRAVDFFVDEKGLERYERDRSRADKVGSTAMVSAHLQCGELSPRCVHVYSRKFACGYGTGTIQCRYVMQIFTLGCHAV